MQLRFHNIEGKLIFFKKSIEALCKTVSSGVKTRALTRRLSKQTNYITVSQRTKQRKLTRKVDCYTHIIRRKYKFNSGAN